MALVTSDDFKAGKKPRALKLIEFETKKDQYTLTVSGEGGDLLRQVDAQHNLNLVFIFGNARSGKSFMLNRLVGVPSLFKVINSSVPCTRGVDISSYVASAKSLHERALAHRAAGGVAAEKKAAPAAAPASPAPASGTSTPPASPSPPPPVQASAADFKLDSPPPANAPDVGFVDVEGQGAEDGTYDTILALPLLLVSKVVLFNHKGAPTVSDMLSKLGVLARAADCVDLGKPAGAGAGARPNSPGGAKDAKGGGDDDDDDDDDDGARGPVDKNYGRPKKFGHLHVLFRDFSFTGDRAEVYEQLMGKEKLPKAKAAPATLQGKGGSKANLDTARRAAIQERNTIRQMLLENFQSINVWLFKAPASADDLQRHMELPPNLIDPSFLANVEELLTVVSRQMHEPTTFHGASLNGTRLLSIVEKVTHSLNTDGLVNVPSVYKAMEKETVNRIGNEVLARFEKMMELYAKDLPQAKDKFDERLKATKNVMLKDYDLELKECLLETEKKAKRDDIAGAADKLIAKLQEQNEKAVVARITAVVDAECDKWRVNFEAYCNANSPAAESKSLIVKWQELKSVAVNAVRQGLSSLPGVADRADTNKQMCDKEEVLQQLLDLRVQKNENKLAERKFENLRNEKMAVEQQLMAKSAELEKFVAGEREKREEAERKLKAKEEEYKAEREKEKKTAEEREKMLADTRAELEKKKKSTCVIL